MISRIDGLNEALDVLDQRISGKFKDYSDRCIAMAQLARAQEKIVKELTAKQEDQKKEIGDIHQEISALSESVNAQVLNTALHVQATVSSANEEENDKLNARIRELQIEVEGLKRENETLRGTVNASSSENSKLSEIVRKLQEENDIIQQEKSILELTIYSNDRSEEIAGLRAQIEKLQNELDETKSRKEFLELSASLNKETTTELSSEKISASELSDLLSCTDSDEGKSGLEFEFREEDYFYREKSMKTITKAEKLLFLLGGTPSSPSTPDPTYEASRNSRDKKHRSRSPTVVKKKK